MQIKPESWYNKLVALMSGHNRIFYKDMIQPFGWLASDCPRSHFATRAYIGKTQVNNDDVRTSEPQNRDLIYKFNVRYM